MLIQIWPSLFWLGAMVLLLVLEAATVGLVSIWFAAGSLAGLIVSFFTPNIWIQITCFLIVSFVALIAVRPLAVRYLVPRRQATNADRVIGCEGVVLQEIDNLSAQGQVRVNGAVWTARSSDEQRVLPVDARVRVDRIEGVKLIVTPLEQPVCTGAEKKEE